MKHSLSPLEETLLAAIRNVERFHVERTVALLEALTARFGEDVIQVVEAVVADLTRRQWEHIARNEPRHTVQDLMRILWEPLRLQGFEFDVKQQGETVEVRCTRCPIHELARELGAADWLYRLHCAPDPDLVSAFNPRMGFRRTQTLMQGQAYCDATYFMRE